MFAENTHTHTHTHTQGIGVFAEKLKNTKTHTLYRSWRYVLYRSRNGCGNWSSFATPRHTTRRHLYHTTVRFVIIEAIWKPLCKVILIDLTVKLCCVLVCVAQSIFKPISSAWGLTTRTAPEDILIWDEGQHKCGWGCSISQSMQTIRHRKSPSTRVTTLSKRLGSESERIPPPPPPTSSPPCVSLCYCYVGYCYTGMPIFRYFPQFLARSVLLFHLSLSELSLFAFNFCETARTRRFSAIFAQVQLHPCLHLQCLCVQCRL